MTPRQDSLMRAISSWTSQCKVNRASIGDLWDVADELMLLHSDLLDRVRDTTLPPDIHSATVLLNAHAMNVTLSLYDLTIHGFLDATPYLERALFDLGALVPTALSDAAFAARVVRGETKLASEARRRVDADLQESTLAAARTMNTRSHASIAHLLRNVVKPEGSVDAAPDGYLNVRVRAGGSTEPDAVRRQWFMALAMHAFVANDTLTAIDPSQSLNLSATMFSILTRIQSEILRQREADAVALDTSATGASGALPPSGGSGGEAPTTGRVGGQNTVRRGGAATAPSREAQPRAVRPPKPARDTSAPPTIEHSRKAARP